MYPINDPHQLLVQALLAAKKRAVKMRLPEKQPGLGTNENGPQLEVPSYPANAFPEDGDHS